jgi:hypothetical protein
VEEQVEVWGRGVLLKKKPRENRKHPRHMRQREDRAVML